MRRALPQLSRGGLPKVHAHHLERDPLGCSIAGVFKIVGALGWGETVEQGADTPPSRLDGSLVGFTQQGLELGKDLLDRVKVGRIRRQEEQLGAGGADQPADRLALVAAEIVHDDDDAGRLKCGYSARRRERSACASAPVAPWRPDAGRADSGRAGGSCWSWPK